MNNNLNKTKIYPYCYKIKENCIPCKKEPNNFEDSCLIHLSKIMHEYHYSTNNLTRKKEKYNDDLFNCLMRYGDIYKKLNIELYVNSNTKQVYFPDNKRIQSNLNLFIKNINTKNLTPEKEVIINEKLKLYNILLNEKLKEKYDEFYYSYGYSNLNSLLPKEYGIIRLLSKENKQSGGNKKNITKTKKLNNMKK
jgi:hypothetical protein